MLLSIKHNRIVNLSILIVLSFSTFAPALAYAAPLSTTAKDWQYVNGNSWAWNYSPQTQINRDNVDQLEIKWIYPLDSKSQVAASMNFIMTASGSEGSTTPPIVRNGVVYAVSNFLRTYAVNATTGALLWKYDYAINVTDAKQRLPVSISGNRIHLHGFRYWEGGDAVLLNGLACDIYGINAKTGKTSFWIKDLCKDIPGNKYDYYQNAGYSAVSSLASIGTYEKGKQFIIVMPGGMHSTPYYGDARHVTVGVDMASGKTLWRVFSYPPHDIPTKDWALQECDTGFFRQYPCSEVAAKNRAQLEWDWAQSGEAPSPYGGVTANWGQAVVDEDTGMIYTNTGNQGPYTNMSMTPGPRLYGSTIMAIDMNKGRRAWWLQATPRDPYDYDCNWSGILAEISGLGKVYMKGCKEGVLYVMNAATGKPYYNIDLADEQIKSGQISSAAAKEPNGGGVKRHVVDPFSTDFREWKSLTDGKYCKAPCNVYPAWTNGVFGTDMSYDPETQTLFHYSEGQQTTILQEYPYAIGKALYSSKNYDVNTTIVARDVATGKVKWTWFQPHFQQRSALVITPSLVFAGFTDGYMRFFDKNTGTLLKEITLGSDVKVGTTTGQDSKGNQKIFALIGTGLTGNSISPTKPGTLVALGLSDKAAIAAKTTTVTTTSVTTASTTITTATTQTVTTTSATTITSTLTPQTTTITSTAPTKTVTTTKEVTQTTGLPSEITYVAVAVAVISLIAAAVLITRKK